eukprot:92857-Rhodomonas_salina.3
MSPFSGTGIELCEAWRCIPHGHELLVACSAHTRIHVTATAPESIRLVSTTAAQTERTRLKDRLSASKNFDEARTRMGVELHGLSRRTSWAVGCDVVDSALRRRCSLIPGHGTICVSRSVGNRPKEIAVEVLEQQALTVAGAETVQREGLVVAVVAPSARGGGARVSELRLAAASKTLSQRQRILACMLHAVSWELCRLSRNPWSGWKSGFSKPKPEGKPRVIAV